MTKAELITEISNTYERYNVEQAEAEDSNGVTWYRVNVFDVGQSEKHNKPIGYRYQLHFYVLDEGDTGESAYFDRDELYSRVGNDIVVSNTLSGKNKVYESEYIRERTLAAILTAANDVLNESEGTTNHAVRVQWAIDAMDAPTQFLNQMMTFIALNGTIQSAGGEATDNDIQYVVNSNIDTVATNKYTAA